MVSIYFLNFRIWTSYKIDKSGLFLGIDGFHDAQFARNEGGFLYANLLLALFSCLFHMLVVGAAHFGRLASGLSRFGDPHVLVVGARGRGRFLINHLLNCFLHTLVALGLLVLPVM